MLWSTNLRKCQNNEIDHAMDKGAHRHEIPATLECYCSNQMQATMVAIERAERHSTIARIFVDSSHWAR